MIAAIDWTMVFTSLIVALPAIIAAVYAGRVHHGQKTPSGKSLGEVAEYVHDTVIANNMLLSDKNRHTKRAEPGKLTEAGQTPPLVPEDQPRPVPEG